MIKRVFSISSIIILAAAMLVLAGCHKDDDVMELPKQPAGYQELLSIYNSGARFLSAEFSPNVTLTFEGQTFTVPTGGIKIEDCRNQSPKVVSFSSDTKMWYLNGIQSGYKYQETLSNEQATSVYCYVDGNTLHLHISNGNVLDFPFIEKPKPRQFRVPIVRITENGEITKETYLPGTIKIEDPDGIYSEQTSFSAPIQIKGRGNSTWGMPKKPYKFKFEEKAEVLGMPSNKKWVLLANYADKSLMRNNVGMELSRLLGFKWTPRSRNVEVYLNGSYIGVYTLFEDKSIGKNRINIKDDEYYLEIEQNMDEDYKFYSIKGVPIQVLNPEVPTEEQMAEAKSIVNGFEEALYGTNFKDPEKGDAAHINVDSFVDNYIIQELVKNIDGNIRKSSFLVKTKSEKLEFYHQWDFDLTLGNADYFPNGNNGPTGWWIRDYGTNSIKNTGWYYRLFQDPAFVEKVKNRWNEVYDSLKTIPDYIDLNVAELGDAPARNFKKWNILGIYVWPNVKVTGSYDKEVEYLKSFYTERLEWLNVRISNF
ncbi:MAG: CotH kinase family protein [Bacteroidales bacterium]|nr:CotH kinase family protein [Bacteroidales bacterium]